MGGATECSLPLVLLIKRIAESRKSERPSRPDTHQTQMTNHAAPRSHLNAVRAIARPAYLYSQESHSTHPRSLSTLPIPPMARGPILRRGAKQLRPQYGMLRPPIRSRAATEGEQAARELRATWSFPVRQLLTGGDPERHGPCEPTRSTRRANRSGPAAKGGGCVSCKPVPLTHPHLIGRLVATAVRRLRNSAVQVGIPLAPLCTRGLRSRHFACEPTRAWPVPLRVAPR